MEARRAKVSSHKSEEAPKTDRRAKSFQKNRGRAKKGGAGGKGTWGKPGVDDLYTDADMALDEGDLNYEGEDFVLESRYHTESHKASKVGVPLASAGAHGYHAGSAVGSPPRRYGNAEGAAPVAIEERSLTLPDFKKQVKPIIAEYFESGDVSEVERAVKELHSPFFHYELVKRAVTMAIDKNDRERELASQLISGLYPHMVPMEQVGKAFERLFELVDDLELDNPETRKLLAQFLGRAVVDEVLPPSFLSDPLVESIGAEIVDETKVLLSLRHGSARLERVWGASAGETADLKRAIKLLVQEYFENTNCDEAVRCLRELNVPHFHHEVVKRVIVTAMDKDRVEQGGKLLQLLAAQCVVSVGQMSIGFGRVKDELSDIALDNPKAKELFTSFVEQGIAAGGLPEGWTEHKAVEE